MDMKRILQAMDGVTNKPVEGADSMSKFLSIVKKNDVGILNEGANPHKVALPVQMAMQHYQQAESTTSSEPSLFKKYFHEVESEVNEQAHAKRQLVNQYASVIAERVMRKQSKNKVLNEGNLEVLRPADGSAPDDYNKIQFRFDGEPVEHGSEEFDYFYKEVFKKDPPTFINTIKSMMDKDHGSMGADPHKDSENDVQDGDVIIPSHPTGHWERVPNMSEMPIAHNPADANNPMIHGHEKANAMNLKDRIAQARAQLKELAQLSDSNELIVWEKITRLSKGGMFMGLEQNLEQIRHGINELVQARKTGKQFPPKARGAIDKNIG